jgi:hypothetical protein
MNIDENFLEYVEERLDQWAKWFSHGNSYGLSFSPCSIEYRLMTVGIINKNPGPKPLPYNEEAEEIEMLVNEMSKQNKMMADVLRYNYFTQGAVRSKAKQLDIPRLNFERNVEMARQWLAGRLSGYMRT